MKIKLGKWHKIFAVMTVILVLGILYFFGSGHGNYSNEFYSVHTNYYKGLTTIKIKKESFKYQVDASDHCFDFYMNASFFKANEDIIGLVKINHKIVNPRYLAANRLGFFNVDAKGRPSIQTNPDLYPFSVQTKYVGITNGIINERLTKGKLNTSKLYRSIMGISDNGDLIIIHSSRWGFISMHDLCSYALKNGLRNALIFDGGSSIDIGIKIANSSYYYRSIPNFFKYIFGIKKPKVYIVGSIK
jgi:hypothetical protein